MKSGLSKTLDNFSVSTLPIAGLVCNLGWFWPHHWILHVQNSQDWPLVCRFLIHGAKYVRICKIELFLWSRGHLFFEAIWEKKDIIVGFWRSIPWILIYNLLYFGIKGTRSNFFWFSGRTVCTVWPCQKKKLNFLNFFRAKPHQPSGLTWMVTDNCSRLSQRLPVR